jgi:hypothetical protein
MDWTLKSLLRVMRSGTHNDQLERLRRMGVIDKNNDLVSGSGAVKTHIEHTTMDDDNVSRGQLDIDTRLNELGKLENGWFEGDGCALSADGVAWVAVKLKDAEKSGMPRPYIYPTLDGGIQVEWSFHGAAEVSAEINLGTHNADLVGVHIKTGAVSDKRIDLDAPHGIDALIAFVNNHIPYS